MKYFDSCNVICTKVIISSYTFNMKPIENKILVIRLFFKTNLSVKWQNLLQKCLGSDQTPTNLDFYR